MLHRGAAVSVSQWFTGVASHHFSTAVGVAFLCVCFVTLLCCYALRTGSYWDLMNNPEQEQTIFGGRARSATDANVLRRKGEGRVRIGMDAMQYDLQQPNARAMGTLVGGSLL